MFLMFPEPIRSVSFPQTTGRGEPGCCIFATVKVMKVMAPIRYPIPFLKERCGRHATVKVVKVPGAIRSLLPFSKGRRVAQPRHRKVDEVYGCHAFPNPHPKRRPDPASQGFAGQA